MSTLFTFRPVERSMKLLLLVVTIILCNGNLEDKDYINPEKNNKAVVSYSISCTAKATNALLASYCWHYLATTRKMQ